MSEEHFGRPTTWPENISHQNKMFANADPKSCCFSTMPKQRKRGRGFRSNQWWKDQEAAPDKDARQKAANDRKDKYIKEPITYLYI